MQSKIRVYESGRTEQVEELLYFKISFFPRQFPKMFLYWLWYEVNHLFDFIPGVWSRLTPWISCSYWYTRCSCWKCKFSKVRCQTEWCYERFWHWTCATTTSMYLSKYLFCKKIIDKILVFIAISLIVPNIPAFCMLIGLLVVCWFSTLCLC